jgi:4-alpha-glucanotransferase
MDDDGGRQAAKPAVLDDPGGITAGYTDAAERWRETSAETRDALLAAMGIDPLGPRQPIRPDVRVLRPDESLSVPRPSDIELEDGTVLHVQSEVPPDLPIGYHGLRCGDGSIETWIIKRPDGCWLDPNMKTWGWAVQLYAARSRQSWGIGDLADLRRLAQWANVLGAGSLLLNPLCAATPVSPHQASPYFPSSRRFRNPLYINIDEIPGAPDIVGGPNGLAETARRLNEDRRIDRGSVLRLKMTALERLWPRGKDEEALDRFCRQSGESLRIFATFCALAERLGADWRNWPSEYRRPDSSAVERFADANAPRVRFHQWLQWLLDEQLAKAAVRSPLVNDLPIGVDPGGADAWQWQDVLASGVTLGAPPDDFNADGQDWNLPPLIPHRLRAARYRPLIETLRASMRHAAGLRIDHVMGLFRLYWIPNGFGPRRGAYVRYPADELLAIVAVESHRARAWIAGEDLGTVEDGVRRRLAADRLLSYKLLWFEDDPPEAYSELSMAAVSTHDLPTVAGLWTGSDFASQNEIGLNPSETGYRQLRQRLLTAARIEEKATAEEAIRAAYDALGRAPSAVLVANLEDALAVTERPNMPGTIDRWPNWSLALPLPLEELEQTSLPRSIAQSLTR